MTKAYPQAEPGIQNLLEGHAQQLRNSSLLHIYSCHEQRDQYMRWSTLDISLDLSFQRMNNETLLLLMRLAESKRLKSSINDLFSGKTDKSNKSPSGHWLLRAQQAPERLAGNIREAKQQIAKMEEIASKLRAGSWSGSSGCNITDIVVLATGGPNMVAKLTARALSSGPGPIKIHFISALDGYELAMLLQELRASRTLFVISSRSFTTPDTLSNAHMALDWLNLHLPNHQDVLKKHFVGISANREAMDDFGIHKEHQLKVWEWASGRFSSCSAFSLPLMLESGVTAFHQLLEGAHAMDEHFKTAPLHQNLPVLLGLCDVWNRNFLRINNRVVLPYDGRLKHYPQFAAQIEMESCGKSSSGKDLVKTAGIIWGQPGSDARHSIHEFIHNGTESCCCEFLLTKKAPATLDSQFSKSLEKKHTICRELCLSTAHAFAFEKNTSASQRKISGTPSTIIELDDLSPKNLGSLISMQEHRVFVQSMLWNVNPFDQKGIDKDKQSSHTIYGKHNSKMKGHRYAVTTNLINKA